MVYEKAKISWTIIAFLLGAIILIGTAINNWTQIQNL
jgi:hypothetical protein